MAESTPCLPQVTTRSIAYGEGLFSGGRYGGPEQVVVEISAGEFRYLETVIDRALAFLEAETTRVGC